MYKIAAEKAFNPKKQKSVVSKKDA